MTAKCDHRCKYICPRSLSELLALQSAIQNEQAVVSKMLLIGIQKRRRVRHLLVHHSPTFLDIAIPMICKLPLAFTVHHRIISITVPIRTVDTDIQIEIHVDHRMLRECMLLEQKKRMFDCLRDGYT